jgi:hypothetical protein
MFVLTANGQSAIRVANWSGKIEERWKTDFGVDIVDKLREVLERVVGLGCGQFIERAETLGGGRRSAELSTTIQWRSTAAAFPMAVAATPG